MSGSDDERLEALEARLARIEGFLASIGMRVDSPKPAEPVAAPPLPVAAPDVPVQTPEQVIEMPDERGAPVLREIHAAENRFGEVVASVPPVAAPAPLVAEPIAPQAASPVWPAPATKEDVFKTHYARAAPRPLPKAKPRHVEQAIGLQLAGWIGAIVLVIGAAMGVKFAYDQGWLGGLPDAVKIGLYYAIGIALIGTGEIVYRKVNAVAAAGIYAAGIATLFVVSYAGNAYYQLYEQQVAFALMAGACAIGALISLRGGMVSIAVLSLLGANIAPIVLRNRAVGEVPLLVYLLTLQVLAIGLAHIGKGAKWWILRNVALVTLSLWMAGRLVSSATAFSVPTAVFLCLYAALFQVENTLAARRQGVSRFSHPTFSFAVTAAFTVALLRWSMPLSDAQRGAIVVLLSFIAFTAGAIVFFAKEEKLKALAQSWLVQGGILLFAAVPVALAGPWVIVAWALMALGYVMLGATIGRFRTAVGGAVVWFAAAGWLLLRSAAGSNDSGLLETFTMIGGVALPAYFFIGLLVSAIGHASAVTLDWRFTSFTQPGPDTRPKSLASVLAISATILAAIVSVGALPSLSTTVAGIAIAWICFAISLVAASTANVYRSLAAAVMTLVVARWVAIDLVADRLVGTSPAQRLILNQAMGIGAVAIGSLLAMVKLLTRRSPMRPELQSQLLGLTVVGATLALAVGLSFEVERAVNGVVASGRSLAWTANQVLHFGLTALWAVAAMALPWIAGALGVAPKQRDELKAGSTLLVVFVTLKFLLIDCLGYMLPNRDVRVMPIVNAQTIVALLLLGLNIMSARTTPRAALRSAARCAIFFLPLVVGSLELHRFFGEGKTLTALSVYWGLYAIVCIVAGFMVPTAVLRFAGLGLLGITLLKIVFVDLASAGTGWRILSFIGVGFFLLLTSVLYGKLSPKLLGKPDEERADGSVPSPFGRRPG